MDWVIAFIIVALGVTMVIAGATGVGPAGLFSTITGLAAKQTPNVGPSTGNTTTQGAVNQTLTATTPATGYAI